MKCAIPASKRCGNRNCRNVIRPNDKLFEVEVPVERYSIEQGCFTYHFENVMLCSYCYRSVGECQGCQKQTILGTTPRGGYAQGNRGFCLVCNDTSIVFDAHIKNKPVYFGENGIARRKLGHIYMGVELEVVVDRRQPVGRAAKFTQESLGEFVFLKWDGSVTNGFEIVTQPASIEYHRKAWTPFINMNENAHALERTSRACGMHVHVGRNALKNRHEKLIDRLKTFIYRDRNRDFMFKIAGRANNNYCQYDVNGDHDRYQALNLSNTSTVEFRIFAGVVDRDIILKNLEAVKAMIDYFSYPKLMPRGSSDYEEFCKFVANNSQHYPFLYAFLRQEGYIKDNMGTAVLTWVMKDSHIPVKKKKKTTVVQLEVEPIRVARARTG